MLVGNMVYLIYFAYLKQMYAICGTGTRTNDTQGEFFVNFIQYILFLGAES